MHRLKKIFLLLFILFCSLQAKVLHPTLSLEISGGMSDMVINNKKLYVCTTKGNVHIFNAHTKQTIQTISLPQIKDFMGDKIESKIYSVDVLNDSILMVAQGEKGARTLYLYKEDKLHTLIASKEKLYIARAKFIDATQIVFSTLSNQLYLYDIKQNKTIYNQQISQSKFSYSVLNETKTEILIADESGDLKIVNTKNGAIKKRLENQNLDNVFQVDWKNDTIITAGQDRQSVIYAQNRPPYIRKSSFLIYGCALSRDGLFGAYSSDEQNNVTVFNTQSNKDLYQLTNNKMTISKILFLNKNEIFVGSDAAVINLYKLQ